LLALRVILADDREQLAALRQDAHVLGESAARSVVEFGAAVVTVFTAGNVR